MPEDLPSKRRKIQPARFKSPSFLMHDKRLNDILPTNRPMTTAQSIPPVQPSSLIQPSPPASDNTDLATNPSTIPAQPISPAQPSSPIHPLPSDNTNHVPSPTRRILDTAQNEFGVFRRYEALTFPTHDPEAIINLEMLSNLPKPAPPITSGSDEDGTSMFYPYPNESSFRLGDWFWNDGIQKSHDSFKKLLAIVGDPKFSSTDVGATNWDSINSQLGQNDWDSGEWVDEDAGWCNSSVTFQVPFPKSTHDPGARPYTITDFYHRSLTSIIREKLSNPVQDPHFHYEPFELLWKPIGHEQPVRLHGELYSSSAFIKAHNDLQNSCAEPGCDLQRVVVGLMFWSDATHLTSFGKAKLWPLYLFFGNDSKYRRCKPSENLCEHVAYFEAVCLFVLYSPKLS